MHKIRITRRGLIKALLVLGAGGAIFEHYWPIFSNDKATVSASILDINDPSHPPFEVFKALSEMITLRNNLDHETSEKMYKVFMGEPWGPENMSGVYTKLRQQLVWQKNKNLPPPQKLSSGETWFISHILTTWYLGIYYHEKRPTERITYRSALMFDVVKDSIPIPFTENTPYGEWSDPPKANNG